MIRFLVKPRMIFVVMILTILSMHHSSFAGSKGAVKTTSSEVPGELYLHTILANLTPKPSLYDNGTSYAMRTIALYERAAVSLEFLDIYQDCRRHVSRTSGVEQTKWKASAVEALSEVESLAPNMLEIAIEKYKNRTFDSAQYFSAVAYRLYYVLLDKNDKKLGQIYQLWWRSRQNLHDADVEKAKNYKP